MSKSIYVKNKFTVKPGKLNKTKASSAKNSNRRTGLFSSKRLFMLSFLAVLLIGVAVLFYTILIPAQNVLNSADRIFANVNALTTDLESKDLTQLDTYIINIQGELDLINEELDKYRFLDNWEFTQGYYQNLQTVKELSDKSNSLLDEALPDLKVVLGSMGYQVDGVTEADATLASDTDSEQLSLVIKELPKLVKLYEDLEPQILDIVETFNELDAEYVPSIGSGNYAQQIERFQKLTADYPSVSSQLKDTLSAMPELLGANGSTTYLVILQNEKELRSSGGLLSAFGTVTVTNGELTDQISTTDTWDLFYDANNAGAYFRNPVASYRNIYGQLDLMLGENPDSIRCGGVALRPQDAGIYPDLYVTMEMFSNYYDEAQRFYPSKYPDYDHVIILNTFFASDLVEFIEPLTFEDDSGQQIVINSDNLAKAIFAETSEAYFDPRSRKSFIGEVASSAQAKVNDLDAKKFPEILAAMIETVQAKNIAFSSDDPEIQAYFDSLGISGRVEQNFDGDYFQLTEAQVCALKANFYIENSVTQDVRINDDTGSVSKDVKVRWEHDTVYDANKHGGILSDIPRFPYRAWMRMLAPVGTDFTASDAFEKSRYTYYPQTYLSDTLGYQTHDATIWYDYRRNSEQAPPTSFEYNVSYNLPSDINYSQDGVYRMLIQKHPGKDDEAYTVNIHHGGEVTSKSFVLDRDMVVTYRQGVISIEPYDQRLDEYVEILENVSNL